MLFHTWWTHNVSRQTGLIPMFVLRFQGWLRHKKAVFFRKVERSYFFLPCKTASPLYLGQKRKEAQKDCVCLTLRQWWSKLGPGFLSSIVSGSCPLPLSFFSPCILCIVFGMYVSMPNCTHSVWERQHNNIFARSPKVYGMSLLE